jgi:hypothetical protein
MYMCACAWIKCTSMPCTYTARGSHARTLCVAFTLFVEHDLGKNLFKCLLLRGFFSVKEYIFQRLYKRKKHVRILHRRPCILTLTLLFLFRIQHCASDPIICFSEQRSFASFFASFILLGTRRSDERAVVKPDELVVRRNRLQSHGEGHHGESHRAAAHLGVRFCAWGELKNVLLKKTVYTRTHPTTAKRRGEGPMCKMLHKPVKKCVKNAFKEASV